MPKRPVLYLDIVGTLLVDKGDDMSIAPFARAFVQEMAGRCEIRLLTSLEEHQALRVCRALGLKAEYVSYRHALGKASSIDFTENFYWVDDDPSPGDILRLADERCSGRLVPVNRREGVTRQTLNKLIGLLEAGAAAKAAETE